MAPLNELYPWKNWLNSITSSRIFRQKGEQVIRHGGGLFWSSSKDFFLGHHDGERMIGEDNPRSFAERDISWTWQEGSNDSWNINVALHLESRQTEVMVFRPQFSNSKIDDDKGVERVLQT